MRTDLTDEQREVARVLGELRDLLAVAQRSIGFVPPQKVSGALLRVARACDQLATAVTTIDAPIVPSSSSPPASNFELFAKLVNDGMPPRRAAEVVQEQAEVTAAEGAKEGQR